MNQVRSRVQWREEHLSSVTVLFPPPLVMCGLLAALYVPLALCFLGSVSKRFETPGVRFRTAVLGGFVFLIASAVVLYGFGFRMDMFDAIAALALVTASAVASFIAWSLIAWGFTINMLIELVAVARPIDEDMWVNLYTHNGGYSRLTIDRMGLLLAVRFAVQEGDHYTLTSAGGFAAKILRLLEIAFGIAPANRKAGA